jgi:hypothetical protein
MTLIGLGTGAKRRNSLNRACAAINRHSHVLLPPSVSHFSDHSGPFRDLSGGKQDFWLGFILRGEFGCLLRTHSTSS